MKRLLWLLLVLSMAVAMPAQKTNVQKKATTTRKQTTTKGKTTTTKKTTTAQKKTAAKTPETIQGLQGQKKRVAAEKAAHERRKQELERSVKQRMNNLLVINTEITQKRLTIDTIRRGITTLEGTIAELNQQLENLEEELESHRQRYMQSMRYMHRNRSVQNRLMFIFSANDFNQMYRRLRFTREYADFQRAQGEAVKLKQEQIEQKKVELSDSKQQMSGLLQKDEQERRQLEGKQAEQQKMVDNLQKEKKTVEALIAKKQQEEAALNQRIERLIAEEVARAKAKAEAEARRKAEAEARKKREEELARKRAAAEAARKENERRIAEAREREERAKAEARAAEKKDAEARRKAEAEARKAERERREAERKALVENKAREREVAQAQKSAEEEYTMPAADRKLSGDFASNKGRLPIPLNGAYKIVTGFGQYAVNGLSNVRLNSNGVNLKGQPGTTVRSVFDGEVSAVFQVPGSDYYIVMLRHGNYISVYCYLARVSVSKGQHVSARQTLGSVGTDGIMQFQLRNWKSPLNPLQWLNR